MLLENLKREMNKTLTTNGDVAFKTTLSANLDFFASIGTATSLSEIGEDKLINSYNENPYITALILLYGRDRNAGAGRRTVVKDSLRVLSSIDPDLVCDLINPIITLGRWDDVTDLIDVENEQVRNRVIDIVKRQLLDDLTVMTNSDDAMVSLLGKWLPSEKSSKGRLAGMWAKELNLTKKEYRILLTDLRKRIDIVENHLRTGEYGKIEFNRVPNKAFLKYRHAFQTHTAESYMEYIKNLANGTVTREMSNVYPHEIAKGMRLIIGNRWLWGDDRQMSEENLVEIRKLNALWENFSRAIVDNDRNTIVVRDGSGSMTSSPGVNTVTPLDVANALSILFSESLKGELHNRFLTFSEECELVDLSDCKTLEDKIKKLEEYDSCTTNIESVFDTLLRAEINLPEDERVDRMVIISDMQFNYAMRFDRSGYDDYSRVIDIAKARFEEKGVKFPEIVFWDASTYATFPCTGDEEGVVLVNGYSNSIISMVLNGELQTPVDFMLEILSYYEQYLDPK